MIKVKTLGIDLATDVFGVHGIGAGKSTGAHAHYA